jgi:hypothetical protein
MGNKSSSTYTKPNPKSFTDKIKRFNIICQTCQADFLTDAKKQVDKEFAKEATEISKKQAKTKLTFQTLITPMNSSEKKTFIKNTKQKSHHTFLMKKYLHYIMNAYAKDIFGFYINKEVIPTQPFNHHRRELQKAIDRRPNWKKGPELFKIIDEFENKFWEFVTLVETEQKFKEITGQKIIKIKNAEDWTSAIKNLDYILTSLSNAILSNIQKQPELL